MRCVPAFLIFFLPLGLLCFGSTSYNVRDFGAKGDGISLDTAALQAAIDKASSSGGGTVDIPPGTYLCGTVQLKSRVTLHLHAGATIKASPKQEDFAPYETLSFKPVDDNETTFFHHALLMADDAEGISILGQGTVDGNRLKRGGPKTIALKNSRRITIRGITVRNSPNYSISMLGCDHVDIDGVSIFNGYSDGIDPDCSRYVRISNCFIDCYDDAICPKASQALGYRRSTEHITVTNCVLSTECSNLKLGTESGGDFKYLAFTNCTMFGRAGKRAPISGISIESVDGSNIEGLVASNLTMRDVRAPIFIRLGNRGRGMEKPAPGSLRNVTISNLIAAGAAVTSSVTGIPGYPARDIKISSIRISAKGGEANLQSLNVPEVIEKYPEATMFGVLPAYGLYARHVEGLTLDNFSAGIEAPDARPALLFDDVRDLRISGFEAADTAGTQPVVWFNRVVGALVQGCRGPSSNGPFLRVTDSHSGNISILANDLRRSASVLDRAPEVPAGAVVLSGNVPAGEPEGKRNGN